MNHQFKQNKSDEYLTKEYAVLPIIKYVPKESIIWCPFDKQDSNFVKVFKENGFSVISSHIDEGKDFFEYKPDNYDLIISNPPYSLREKILIKLFSLKKPLLVNVLLI